MKRSRRELSIDMVIHEGIFENNLLTLFPCFTFIPQTGGSFHCEDLTYRKLIVRNEIYFAKNYSNHFFIFLVVQRVHIHFNTVNPWGEFCCV